MRRAHEPDVYAAMVTHLTRPVAMRPEKAYKSTISDAPGSCRTDPNLGLADERFAGIADAAALTRSTQPHITPLSVERVDTTRIGRHR
jgi:hypothetical protein